jgi:hypothetical protein
LPKPLALLPVANLSGAPAPLAELQAGVEVALQMAKIPLVSGTAVEEFLARHRMRSTADISADAARAAGEELGVSGVILTTLAGYSGSYPPVESIVMRLVAADSSAGIQWIDQVARTGDESPGLFDTGVVRDVRTLQRQVLAELGASLARALAGNGPRAPACQGGSRFAPREQFRSPHLEASRVYTVAVLPFVNETNRRGAGDLLALLFAAQLEASGRFRAVEPGVVREQLLQFRIVMENGVSLDTARVVLELVQADFVVAGYLREYEDPAGGVPSVQFTTLWLDRSNNEVVWESTSSARGDEGVFFFDVGRVTTALGLSCRLVRSSLERVIEGGASPAQARRLSGQP